ncbi:MAG: hypothetical protein M1818_004953 [Claussenomyces sp. TS43310]|nr:MAG: hypothetical protein M1818_004953 [Claussenomyces sp. TS43310]
MSHQTPPPQARQAAYAQEEAQYTSSNPKSQELYNEATKSLPGGNTRSVLFYPPFPLTTVSAESCHLTDADGHVYTDFLGEYTAGLYGHSNRTIQIAISAAVDRGLSFGSHHADESKLARLIRDRFPSIDLLRFTNSGTEASLMALAAAKVFTGRDKILVFDGGYHGGVFAFVHGSSPLNAPHDYLIARYNDILSVDDLLAQHGPHLAAIIVEPLLGSGGAIPATPAFLNYLRACATAVGALLIFDEVMTSRLFSGGGVQTELAITPDLTTLGKYLGGGLSFGAFGGRQAIMRLFDPREHASLRHAGTFNNNVLTMAAGRAGLESIFTPAVARALHARGDALRLRLNTAARGTLLRVTGSGSIMAFHFSRTPADEIRSPQDLSDECVGLGDLLHLYLLRRRFYIARRGFVTLSLPLGEDELEGFVNAVEGFIAEYRALLQV